MLALADHEISRFPSKERAHMPVSKTTPGRLGARVIAPIRVAFRQRNDVGTRDEGTFAAQWLAYAVRSSFIVMDLHHLFLAGLPAHSALPPPTDIVSPARQVQKCQQETGTSLGWPVQPGWYPSNFATFRGRHDAVSRSARRLRPPQPLRAPPV